MKVTKPIDVNWGESKRPKYRRYIGNPQEMITPNTYRGVGTRTFLQIMIDEMLAEREKK